MLSERLQTTLHKKNFRSMLGAYAILVLCNVVPEAPSNIAQEKIQAIQAMSFEQHLFGHSLYICIYQVLHVKKNIKLCFLYYENRLKLTLKKQLGIIPSNRSKVQSYTFQKSKTFSQPYNVPDIHAILSRGFRKVSRPRLQLLLTLNKRVLSGLRTE